MSEKREKDRSRKLSEKDLEEERRRIRRKWVSEQEFYKKHAERKRMMIKLYEKQRAWRLIQERHKKSSEDVNESSQQENVSDGNNSQR